jgi:hypothetical protein
VDDASATAAKPAEPALSAVIATKPSTSGGGFG